MELLDNNIDNIFLKKYEKFTTIKDYIYNSNTRKKIFSIEIKGIDQSYDYLMLLHQELKFIKPIENIEYSQQGIVSYFDIFDEKFYFFNFKEFNKKASMLYIKKFLPEKKLINNDLYKLISFYIECVYFKYKYPFFKGIYSLFDIKSGFFLYLRKSVMEDNLTFSLPKFFEAMATQFFSSEITPEQHLKFFGEIITVMINNKIIEPFSEGALFKFKSEYYHEINELIYCIFNFVIFGNDGWFDKFEVKFGVNLIEIEKLSQEYNKINVVEKYKIDNYIFGLLCSSISSEITMEKNLNNYYYDIIYKKK